MPFAGYKDFDDCVKKHMDKINPRTNKKFKKEDAQKVCATIQRKVEEGKKELRLESPIFEKTFKAFIPVTKSYVAKDANGIERKHIEVTVSGLKEDRDGERMSQKALDMMRDAFKQNKVPAFNNHGMDKHGNRTYDWRDMVGKWVDADQDGVSLKATMQINEANPDGVLLWKYVHEQDMPVGFSVGGKVIHSFREEVQE